MRLLYLVLSVQDRMKPALQVTGRVIEGDRFSDKGNLTLISN